MRARHLKSCVFRTFGVLAACIAGANAPAGGQMVQWSAGDGGNDHYYELVLTPGGITWADASAAANAAGGYLSTITSSAENSFVYSLASATPSAWFLDTPGNGIGPWLGGYQATFTSEPAGGWAWVTGEPWSFTAWASPLEPNNWNGAEDRLNLFGYETLMAPTWNDFPNNGNAPDGPPLAYLVEYNTAPIPEPSTTAALLGLVVLGFVLRLKSRPPVGGRPWSSG